MVADNNRTPWIWTKQRHAAAIFLAEGELTDCEICQKVGRSRAQLWRWKQHPEFAARVQQIAKAIGDRLRHHAIARKVRRVEALNERWEKMHQIIAERAAAEEMQAVPGGKTGLVVKTVKGVEKGDDFRLVESYEVDTALLKAILEHERRAAEEAGEVGAQPEGPTVNVNVTNVRMTLEELKRLPPEELRRRHREALRLPDGRSSK
jgi:hypothetical protein